MNRRDCQTVIAEMLERIPDTKESFIKDLQWNYEDAFYKAPEETLQWHRTMDTVQKHIPHPTKDWEFEVLSIFTTRSIESLKETFNNSSI